MNPTELSQAILDQKWLPLAVLVIMYLTRLLRDDSKFPVSVPARWRPVIVVILGQVLAVLLAVQSGTSWKAAIITGVAVSLFTMGLFDLVVRAIFGDKLPWWIDILSFIFPAKPKPPSPEPIPTPTEPLEPPKDS